MAENDTASASSATPTEELDLMIRDMDTETAETRSRKSWRGSRDQVPPPRATRSLGPVQPRQHRSRWEPHRHPAVRLPDEHFSGLEDRQDGRLLAV